MIYKEKTMITVILADDHEIVRNVLRTLLERAGDIKIVALAANGQEAVTQAILLCPNVAVLDGIEAARQISARCPKTKVLMLSMYDSSEYVRNCIKAGALGYVLKEMAAIDLVVAIRSLFQGKSFFSEKISRTAKGLI
jgi:DNA-binding NarL/FixJ family response regulator